VSTALAGGHSAHDCGRSVTVVGRSRRRHASTRHCHSLAVTALARVRAPLIPCRASGRCCCPLLERSDGKQAGRRPSHGPRRPVILIDLVMR